MSDDDGLTAREFLEQFVPLYERASLFPGPQRPEWYRPHALKALRSGEWYATGFLLPLKPPGDLVRIEASLWPALDFHLYDGTVFGSGIEYSGVRFFEHKPEPKKTIADESACLKHLVELMKNRKRLEKEKCRTAALEEFKGLSGKGFDRAWIEAAAKPTTHPSWRKRGPVESL